MKQSCIDNNVGSCVNALKFRGNSTKHIEYALTGYKSGFNVLEHRNNPEDIWFDNDPPCPGIESKEEYCEDNRLIVPSYAKRDILHQRSIVKWTLSK